jgi:hypothetical protein
MKRSIITAITAAISVLAFAAPALASTPRTYYAGPGCKAQGGFAICVASGTAVRPSRIILHVSSTPGQHVSGAWDSVCAKGLGAGSRSGSFSGTAPLTRIIRRAYVFPSSCTVAGDAQLSSSGKLHIWISYNRW